MPYSFSDPGYPASGTHDDIGPVPNFAPAGAPITQPPEPDPLAMLFAEFSGWRREVLVARRDGTDLPLMASERQRITEIVALLREKLLARGLTGTAIRDLPALSLCARADALPTVTDCLDAIGTLRSLSTTSDRLPEGE